MVRFINFKEGNTQVEHESHPVASEKNQDAFPSLTLINLRQKHAICGHLNGAKVVIAKTEKTKIEFGIYKGGSKFDRIDKKLNYEFDDWIWKEG